MDKPAETILGCFACGAVYELAFILAQPHEFIVEDGELRCPICGDRLYDVTPVPMPDVFAEFIAGMAL